MRVIAVLSFPLMAFLFLIVWISVTLRHKNRVVVAMRFMGMTLNITADQNKTQPHTRATDERGPPTDKE